MNVYMDNAATTTVSEDVLQAMLPYLTQHCGNPSSLHGAGRAARKAVDEARSLVAEAIGAEFGEIYFTGSGTEADNWALRGAAYANRHKGNHIITSAVEHHAILHTCQRLEKEGFRVTYLPVDKTGTVLLEQLKAAICKETILISVMLANNEIGTIEPIRQIAQIGKEAGVLVHTDAVQAVGSIPVNVNDLSVDMLSLSGHKFHAPKGVGALYIRSGVHIDPLLCGGEQEKGMRAGTENVASIAGLGRAITNACSAMDKNRAYVEGLRDSMIAQIQARIPYAHLSGHPTNRLPGNIHFCFEYVEGESLLLNLDMMGIAASSGSACAAGALEPSHVLLATGMPYALAKGSLRLSANEQTTSEEIAYVVDCLETILKRLRSMHPAYPGDPA